MNLNDGMIQNLQTAVIRTNCIDCLDRTPPNGLECRYQRGAERLREEYAADAIGSKGEQAAVISIRQTDM